MKIRRTILFASLILFVTLPGLASANENHRNHRDSHHGWGDRSYSYSVHHHYGDRYPSRHNKHYRQHKRRQFKHELRETRRELRHAKQKIRHLRSRPYYAVQPYYVTPPVVIGYPSFVFQFGW